MADQGYAASTHNIWPYYAKGNLPPGKAKGTNEMGKDEFLHILITQLKNQDPMQPLQDREFIAQMAQFTSVEQIMNVGKELNLLRNSFGFAASLIGKSVTWNVIDSAGQLIGVKTGIVDAILMKDGKQFFKSGVDEQDMEAIVKIESGEENAQ